MTNELTFRLPKSYFIVLITLTVSISSITLFLLLEDGITETFFVLPWTVVFLILTIAICRWKLTIKDKQIIHTPIFGKTKSFTFSDITKIKCGTEHWDYEDYNYIEAYREKEMLFYVNNRCKAFKALVLRLKEENIY